MVAEFVAPPLRDALGFGFAQDGRLANASGPNRGSTLFVSMEWSFASGCSPPRIQRRSYLQATEQGPVFPSGKDFHPSVGEYFQAPCPGTSCQAYARTVPGTFFATAFSQG